MSKYHSKKIKSEGLTFDSKKELQRWNELRLMERVGAIQDLQRQVKYLLIPAQYEEPTRGPRGGLKRGKLIERECAYIADFVYQQNGKNVVELLLYQYGIKIKET